MYMYLKIFFHEREFIFLSVIFFAEHGTSLKSHATHAVERGSSMVVVWILQGTCVGFAWVSQGT